MKIYTAKVAVILLETVTQLIVIITSFYKFEVCPTKKEKTIYTFK
jgi:hypothetical protein